MNNNIEIKKEDLFLYDKLLAKQDQYPQYVINLQNQLFSKNGIGAVLANLKDMVAWDADKTVALLKSMVNIIKRVNQDFNIRIDAAALAPKSWSNYQSAFSAYIEIVNDYIVNNPNVVSKNKTQWKLDYSVIADEAEILATRIDGTDSLLAEIGRDAMDFVRLVLENSYFFDPKVVALQHQNIRGAYLAKEKLPARWTETYKKQYSGMSKDEIKKLSKTSNSITYSGHPVQIDKDGNYAVRDLIKTKFGYTVSQGQNSIFQYYKISHIWGEAYDPIKFTNLWNLVLVPAWANDLLDKSYSRNDLTVTFKQVIKFICLNFYKMKNLNWNDLMPMPVYQEQHEKDMLAMYHGEHLKINWIEGITQPGDLGKIKKATVTI